ncbi:MAG: DUF134 domain-containing protein [Methanothrix sp.]
MCPCRGRRRGRRWISEVPVVRCFMPEGCPKIEALSLNLEELEAVRLVDLLDLDQEEAAFYMGISRKALWNDLMNARHKIAAALVYGMGLRIEGGSFILRGEESQGDMAEQLRQQSIQLMEKELAFLQSRRDLLISRLEPLKKSIEADLSA